MKEGKTEYLAMIQEPICRMSTISAILKGFSATIIAAIASISFTEINKWVLLLAFVPLLSFLLLDIYYLKLERKFRYLYDQVRTEKHEIDFSMAITNKPLEIIEAKATNCACIKSPSIWLFYLPLIIVAVTITALKFVGVL